VTRAPQSPETLAALQRVTDAALAYLSLDELLTELLHRTTEILDTDTAAFLLLDDAGDTLVARAAKGIEEEVEQGVRIPVGRGFAGRIAAERHAITIDDVDHADILNPILRERGIRSLLGVPLLVEGDVIGVLHVGTLTPRQFTAGDQDLLQLAADRAALAIQNARLFHDRRVVESLQRMLITDALPTLPGLELAGRYRPAAGRSIGGDWYDAFVLSRGEVALVIGDVMGHGIAAAALMAQVRTGLRAYALDGHSPAGVTERLNRLALSLGPNEMTTLAYGVVDVDRRRLRTISAGHVPPLVRDAAGGEVTVLPVEGDPPLGVSPDTRYREHAFELSPGSTVVLVTDGAIEVRGEGLDRGLERVRELVVAHDDLVGLCDAIARGDARGEPAEDDVAVLAARVTD
jgi:serine phosphatase RsbU (regulator of sigma subunit)